MSREIKFRVLIDYRIYYQDEYDAYSDNLTSIDICKKTITITSFYNYENVYRFEDEKVKLMQYTGLKDKNSKEIYEGDIIRLKHHIDKRINVVGKVVFLSEQASFGIIDDLGQEYPLFRNTTEQIEIIGNIYENSELLAGKDE